MTIYTELSRIQKELKAPKGQFNRFGNYKYRSCEDILEAVKPLLGDCSLTVSDEIIVVADRFYIKATAKLSLSDNEFVANSALAREPESKKGMDEAQVTGATSSYARKYALNGLFAIDDTKDADAGKDEQAEDFKKSAAQEKRAATIALNKGESKPQPKGTLEERYQKAMAFLKNETPESFKAKPSYVDSINTLLADLNNAGVAGYRDKLLTEFNRVFDLNDGLPDFLQGEPKHDYRI